MGHMELSYILGVYKARKGPGSESIGMTEPEANTMDLWME